MLVPPLSVCLSVFSSLLPTVFFSLFIFHSSLPVLLFVNYSLPPFSNRPIHPLKVHLGCGWGGREGCSGWAFLLSLRWQQDRGAIDSSTGPHSWLMLECVISWQFSHTEIDRAEFLSCTVHFGFSALRVLLRGPQVMIRCCFLFEETRKRKLYETRTQTSRLPNHLLFCFAYSFKTTGTKKA